MNRKKLLYRLTALVCFIFLINIVAHKLYWYSSISYFDMIMHFLGGFFLLLAVAYVFPPKVSHSRIKSITLLISGVLVIGIGWEVFEYIFNNVLGGLDFDILDTLSDLFFDMLGGTISLFYFLKRIMIKS